MSLTYVRDKYKKLSEDILDGNIDINNNNHRLYLYKELEILGESNIEERIKKITGESNIEERIKKITKHNRNKSEKSNLVKDIFREVNGENNPEIKVEIKSTTFEEEIYERNERKISTDKPYEESGYIKIDITNYTRYDENEDIYNFIKFKGNNISPKIKKKKFEDNNLSLEIEYTIAFKRKTRQSEYKESIEITFRDVESKIYEFFISCSEENNKIYNFNFKNIDELYIIFKEDLEKYNNSEKDCTYIKDIFKDNDFTDYLNYIKEYAALDLYKSLNLISYKFEDLNLFFTTLGYKECYIRKTNVKVKPKSSKIVNKIEQDIELRFLKLYYIENIENNLEIKVFSNKNNDIKVKRVIEIIPSKIQRLLNMLLKEKMEKFNSYIYIKDTKILRHAFIYFIKKESVQKTFKILISSEKSNKELNLYTLRVHM